MRPVIPNESAMTLAGERLRRREEFDLIKSRYRDTVKGDKVKGDKVKGERAARFAAYHLRCAVDKVSTEARLERSEAFLQIG